MPGRIEALAYLDALRSNSITDSEALAAIRALVSVARPGVEFHTACTILETASCHPPKDIFGDSVHGLLPLDEAAASRYILRAVSTLDLHLTAVHSLELIPLPELPRPRNKDAPIIEELSPEEAQLGIDVPSIVLTCLLHVSSPQSEDLILTPAAPWANESTAKRAFDILAALCDRSIGDARRDVLALEGCTGMEVMLQQICIPCMKQVMISLDKQPRAGDSADDHLHEGLDSFQKCTAAYQALQYTLQLHHPHVSECVPPLLPVLTSALADPIPFVKRCAAAALSHVAQEATAAALYVHASILKSCISRAFIGCEGPAWDTLLQAGCGVATRLDSVTGTSEHRIDVLKCTMEEVKRLDSVDLWRPWLGCLAGYRQGSQYGLLHCVGVEVLCCTSTLMPMLLERLVLANRDETKPICQVLQSLKFNATRRMHAHGDVVLLGLRCAKQSLYAQCQDDEMLSVIAAVEETERLFQAEE